MILITLKSGANVLFYLWNCKYYAMFFLSHNIVEYPSLHKTWNKQTTNSSNSEHSRPWISLQKSDYRPSFGELSLDHDFRGFPADPFLQQVYLLIAFLEREKRRWSQQLQRTHSPKTLHRRLLNMALICEVTSLCIY
jgi:hypothetical protein